MLLPFLSVAAAPFIRHPPTQQSRSRPFWSCALTSHTSSIPSSPLSSPRFKGVVGNHAVVSISTRRTAAREFPGGIKKSKGEMVARGAGPLYRVRLSPEPGEGA